jgi:hypothetical protein
MHFVIVSSSIESTEQAAAMAEGLIKTSLAKLDTMNYSGTDMYAFSEQTPQMYAGMVNPSAELIPGTQVKFLANFAAHTLILFFMKFLAVYMKLCENVIRF